MRFGTYVLAVLLFSSSCQKRLSEQELISYRDKGTEISRLTYERLSGTLVQKMQAGGIPDAVVYCNSAAQGLTDQMAGQYGVALKRTSLRTRNQENAPDEDEIRILKHYQDLKDSGVDPEALVEIDHLGNPHYYAPILMEKRCLVCHGRLGLEVSPVADSIIKSYYPDDRAVGFEENDLRGIWSIAFLER